MRVVSRNEKKIRKNKAIFQQYNNLLQCNDFVSNTKINFTSKDLVGTPDRGYVYLSKTIPEIISQKIKYEAYNLRRCRTDLKFIGEKPRIITKVISDMENIYNSSSRLRITFVGCRKNKSGGRPKIESMGSNSMVVLSSPIGMYYASQVINGYDVPLAQSICETKNYAYHIVISATKPYEVEHDRIGMVRLSYVNYFHTSERKNPDCIRHAWLCQPKAQQTICGLGVDPVHATKVCMRNISKKMMKDV